MSIRLRCAAKLFEEAKAHPWPATLNDTELPCLCPSGRHLAWFVAETDDPEALLAAIPPKFRRDTKIHELAVALIGSSIPTA